MNAEPASARHANRLLRRDTLSLGDGLIRSVGDQLPPFASYDQDGEIITTDYFDGSATVLNFIFTRCSVPDMCPASTMKMKKLQSLAEKTEIERVKFLSITLDPLCDLRRAQTTRSSLWFERGKFSLRTAGKSVIDDLTRQFGLLRKNDESLTIEHTISTLWSTTAGKLFTRCRAKTGRRRTFFLAFPAERRNVLLVDKPFSFTPTTNPSLRALLVAAFRGCLFRHAIPSRDTMRFSARGNLQC